MLSYRHSYHAGNHADVLKHIIQLDILQYLMKKDKPVCYIDTHSGAGFYKTKSEHMQKNAEYKTGIAKLWGETYGLPILDQYLTLLAQYNAKNEFLYYPGSPKIAADVLRPYDKLRFCELHPRDAQTLTTSFKKDGRVRVYEQDGYEALKALLPPQEKRGLVLVDPSYELKYEYNQLVKHVEAANKKFATGTFSIWYPVIDREAIERFIRKFSNLGIDNILLAELCVRPDARAQGMTGSGMIVIRPHYTLKASLEAALPLVLERLGEAGGSFRVEQLVKE